MQSLRYIKLERYRDVIVAELVESILRGSIQIEILKLELQQALAEGASTFILDFRNVKMISSNVVECLLAIKQRASHLDVNLKLCSMAPEVRDVFRTLNLDGSILEIVESKQVALRAESRPRSYYEVCGRVSPPDEEYDTTTVD
jgi:anti-anti-sigma regulatory factor